MVFIVDLAMTSAMDRIESSLPPTVPLSDITGREGELEAYIHGCIGTVGTVLAALWANTIGEQVGDGMAIDDALKLCGFEKFALTFVAERKKSPKINEGAPLWPDTKPLAEKFVTENWGDYFSPYSDLGCELDDGYLVEFPDPYSGDMRMVDKYGNHVETREYGDTDPIERAHWLEWYKLFDEAGASRYFEGLPVKSSSERAGVINEMDLDTSEAHVVWDDDPDGEGEWIPVEVVPQPEIIPNI